MKKLISILMLVSILLTACTNLDDIYDQLKDHESRIKSIESLMKTANSEIEAIKKLVDAQNKKITIVSYAELADKSGYELVMSDGSKITLKNGKDGVKPMVGVKKHTDGLFYWTIDGEFMRDADGKMVKAEGQDGADGITPKLRINADNNWEMSVDGGKTWQEMKDANGNPISAKGKDATVDLTITETEDAIIIKYNGQTFTISKKNNGEEPNPDPEPNPDRPVLSIDYLAEYNVQGTGESIALTKTSFDYGEYYTWAEATTIKLPQGYHLASQDEWRGIVPDAGNVTFKKEINDKKNVTEKITINGTTKIYTANYINPGQGITYAIRFNKAATSPDETPVANDDNMLSAWRYEYTSIPANQPNNAGMMLKITVRHILASETLENISKEEWWANNAGNDIIRFIPAAGFKMNDSKMLEGSMGCYWSSTEDDADYAKTLTFTDTRAVCTGLTNKTRYFSIRPFKN